MSKHQHLMARDQLAAIAKEEARRKRAEMRWSYGNKFSSINLNKMRQKKESASGDLAMTKASAVDTPLEVEAAPPKDTDMALRRIASSFAHVRDSVSGNFDALPPEESEEDAGEERAEVLICSQAMPMPMPMALPSDHSSTAVEPVAMPDEPLEDVLSQQYGSLKLPVIVPEPLQLESRATERWQQLGSTVSALFRARRYIDSPETPVAQTRRLREQRELLEAFTRPFLFEAHKRD
ncbi:uncharacterized protein LOC128260650 [Drosophila gunungcola]|uniref:Uncharacterized protein n=1 Tax=Drosophila gunungcola TaxID=103775 RepID=A0A9P9YEF0_9MUSC|nr:uncharacterized protein LOC128260650 [Drosophila gunungcola]KAI8035448.1 hypothetical protein M5D96_011791 [Drosophila gunungcola]